MASFLKLLWGKVAIIIIFVIITVAIVLFIDIIVIIIFIIFIIIIIIIITALGIHTIFSLFSSNNININKLAERKYSEKFVQKLFAVIYNENRLSDSEIFFAEV